MFSCGSDSMWAAHKQAGKHMGKQIKHNDHWLLLAFVSEAFYDQNIKKWRTGERRNFKIYNMIEQPQKYSFFL